MTCPRLGNSRAIRPMCSRILRCTQHDMPRTCLDTSGACHAECNEESPGLLAPQSCSCLLMGSIGFFVQKFPLLPPPKSPLAPPPKSLPPPKSPLAPPPKSLPPLFQSP